jgi:hypothetical protein
MNIMSYKNNQIPTTIPININNTNTDDDSEYTSKKLLWGPPIWNLLHTISCKIHESYFQEHKKELFDIITAIITNLPCHICSTHAKQYITMYHFHQIQTKQELILFMYHFHNAVNQKKNNPYFTIEQLSMYQNTVTFKIIHIFLQEFMKKSMNGTIRMISDEMHRKALTQRIHTYFMENMYIFDT